VVSTSGKGGGKAPAGGYKIDDNPPPPTANGILLSELLSGYPIPPSLGPGLTGDMIVLTDPTAWPFSAGQSNVAVVPVLLTGAPSGTGPVGSSGTLTFLDVSTGTTFSVPVAIVPAVPAQGAGVAPTTPGA
jgi:hypothetical protein